MIFQKISRNNEKTKRQNHRYSSKTTIHYSKTAFEAAPGRKNAQFE
jgi:hypothetical protein